jgi:hypothetical protein
MGIQEYLEYLEYLDVAFFYNFKKSGGLKPLARAKVMPKLLKQGIPMYILLELSAVQLSEMLYLIIRILYETKAQLLGIPQYIPGPYRNKDLSTVMCLEKIWYLSPAVHFFILRTPSFFAVDRLGIQQEFYEFMMSTASGENPENVVMTARSNFLGYTFAADDLRDQLDQGGLKEGVKSTTPKDPSPTKDIQVMEVDQETEITDLRAKITGKPAPPRVELNTKPKQVKPAFTSRDVRFKDQEKMLKNSKALTEQKIERKKNTPNRHRWTGHGTSSSFRPKSESSKLPPKPGARKASAYPSPGRGSIRKRERSPTDTSFTSAECRSPARRRRSRPPTPSR